ncbi:MAG TPA: type VII secretion integral membrane protein EccD [Trebonia sp.]
MPVMPAAGGGEETRAQEVRSQETCRLTIDGPAHRADLTVPATLPVGELLPILLRHVLPAPVPGAPPSGNRDDASRWVLQRLGEEPLDPDQTAETLRFRDGEVLYLRQADDAFPALTFDDVAVGVAGTVQARADNWRPDFTKRLLLGAAAIALASFALGALAVPGGPGPAVYYGVGAIAAAVGSVVSTRLLGETAIGLVAGLAAIVFAAAEGLTATTGDPGGAGPLALSVTPSHVLLAGLSATVVAAAVLLVSRRAPVAPYAGVLMVAVAATAGGWLAASAHWDAASATGLLAVLVFMAGTLGARIVLNIVRIRAPYPPSNAEELQLDIEPEPAGQLVERTGRAVSYLNGLTVGSAVVCVAAFAQLNRDPSWPGWLLSALLAIGLLLRARILVALWQRASLAVAGTLGIVATLVSLAVHAPAELSVLLVIALPVAAVVLLVGAARLPGRRLLPVWAHAADIGDAVVSVAMVPLLLELVHAFSFFRSLAG